MKISYYPEQTALQSEPIWQAFLESCKRVGIIPVQNSLETDCALIWSVLWRGRMQKNRQIYEHYRSLNKAVFIVEVVSLIRGKTWKVCINNITNQGIYANTDNFLPNRHKKLCIDLKPKLTDSDRPILIAGQHTQSLQWNNNLDMESWIYQKIKEIRQYSDRKIYIRPHPRERISNIRAPNVLMNIPIKIPNSYDEYDLNFDYKIVINFNSGVLIKAAIHGCSVHSDKSSLVSDIGTNLYDIENSYLPDRHSWFEQIVHTEWTIEEIREGIPLKRLLNKVDLTSN